MSLPTTLSQRHSLWTREDVANHYRVSIRTVGEWIAARRIPFLRIGRAVRFRPESVEKALEKFEVKAVTR
jgi:excisionase family DNA binding protein